MVGKLAPNSTYSTRGLVRFVPGWGCFRAVPSPKRGQICYIPSPPNRWTGRDGVDGEHTATQEILINVQHSIDVYVRPSLIIEYRSTG